MDQWTTPKSIESFKPRKDEFHIQIKIWEKDEFLSILQYEHFPRKKAVFSTYYDIIPCN